LSLADFNSKEVAITDGIIVLGFIAINTILAFVQEYHSEQSLKALQRYVVPEARVRREGKEVKVKTSELVPGDIVVVEAGDIIPADIRFVAAANLLIDESVLTGESVPVSKQPASALLEGYGEVKEASKDISKAVDLGFSSTTVISGKAEGVVFAIGKDTQIGTISKLTVETHHQSSFEKGIIKFSTFILRMIVVILVFLFIINVAIKGKDANIAELVLFSIALAVSVVPEALPIVTTISFSRGAERLAKNKVVVKRLSAVEDLGSIEVLCTDKTGTLTENKLKVSGVRAEDEKLCFFSAALASEYIGDKKRDANNSFDIALWSKLTKTEQAQCLKYKKISEVPFDPRRKRSSVLVDLAEKKWLIVRGAPEVLFELSHVMGKDKKECLAWLAEEGRQGRRVIGIARKIWSGTTTEYTTADEAELTFLGMISFVDPIKSTTLYAVEHARKLGVAIKILTGDSREVAGAVATQIKLIQDPTQVLTGEEFEKLSTEKQKEAVEHFSVFARVSPEQKYAIIERLEQLGKEVGFLGEGINDAPALKIANVGIVVSNASDIAREAADVVLLHNSLSVFVNGIREGREIFANVIKYIKITLIANFGNFYTVATAALLLPYLPILPLQILVLNLITDFPLLAIATDRTDHQELRRPRSYDVREIILIALILGTICTLSDFVFFGLFRQYSASVLQTAWFVESALTELVLIFSIRTRRFMLQAVAPSWLLVSLTVLAGGVTVALPFIPFTRALFRFTHLSTEQLILVGVIVIAYLIATEAIKVLYYRMRGNEEERHMVVHKAKMT
jgi:Mg2+-importing ATPase